MNRICLLTALSLGAAPLNADPLPHRENIGKVPPAAPASAGEYTSSSTDKLPGAVNPGTVPEKSADEQFIHHAAKAVRMELKFAELAVTQASRDDLKTFAAMQVKDLSAANAVLVEIAKALGAEIPDPSRDYGRKESGSFRPENDTPGKPQKDAVPRDPGQETERDTWHTLKDKTGVAFDAAFMQIMKEGLLRDIALFERAKGNLKAPALQTFAAKILPVLITHAAALEALEKKDPNRPAAKTSNRVVGTPNPVLPPSDHSNPPAP